MDIVHNVIERLDKDINVLLDLYEPHQTGLISSVAIRELDKLILKGLDGIKYREYIKKFFYDECKYILTFNMCLSSYVLRFTNIYKLKTIRCPRSWPNIKRRIYSVYINDIVVVWELLRVLFPWKKYNDMIIDPSWPILFRNTLSSEFI